MLRIILLSILLFAAMSTKVSSQVSNIHGAWIEVHSLSDSMDVRLMILSKQATLLPLSQSLSVFDISPGSGILIQQPAIQLDRILSLDSNGIRFSVFNKRLAIRTGSLLYAWNACCRGPLLNATPSSNNESMVAYTIVYPDEQGTGRSESIRISSFPPMTYTLGLPQTTALNWQQVSAQQQTTISLSIPIASLENNQFQPVSGARLPNLNEASLMSNELTVFAAEAGNLAFNLRYLTTANVNNTTVTRSFIEAAFQVNIQNAASIKNLLQDEGQPMPEIYDLMGRYLGNYQQSIPLAPGTYLFKRGNKVEKVQVF